MAMNPVKLMQIKATIAGVERRHPNLRKFFEAVGREELREGTILELIGLYNKPLFNVLAGHFGNNGGKARRFKL